MALKRSIQQAIRKALIDEFTGQGHNNTGKLLKSIKFTTQYTNDYLDFSFVVSKYGEYLNQDSFSFNAFTKSRGFKKLSRKKRDDKYYSDIVKSKTQIGRLAKWILQRGTEKTPKDAVQGAFAIIFSNDNTSPTRNSYKFSKNGRRSKWIDESLGQLNLEPLIGSNFEDLSRVLNRILSTRNKTSTKLKASIQAEVLAIFGGGV